jgi:general secretion pathway protein D
MKQSPYPLRIVLTLLVLGVLVGCAQQRIREETTAQLREGNFEAAIAGLQSGVAQYPESALLRAGLAAARSEAIARLVAEASQFKSVEKFEETDKTIARGLLLEPGNSRLITLQGDLALARRQRTQLEEINAFIAAGKKDKALRGVEGALRDAPRQPNLLALQRRLELELRLDSGVGAQRSLAESRPTSLDFRNASLSAVLDAITKGSGINFILDRDVRQDAKVTLYLRSARVDDAIDLVIGANQLARRTIDATTVLIYPNTPEKQREHQEQVIRVFHLANAEAKSTAAFLKTMLRIKDPYVDEKANMLSIRESPELVALAERLVALHDVGDAEVMMEVEILEIKTSRLTELGINFPNSLTLTPLAATGQTGLTLGSLNSINNDRIGVSVGNLLINLRREVGDFNILANPRIRSKNREKASILIGDKVPVITSTSSATGFVAESVSYLDVGLKLNVEPVVSPDDEVTIKLGLEVSTLAKEVRTSAGSLAYQIGTRNATTTLRLRDGETQLLAGLISNEDRSTSNRVPGLGDLPIAGRLFSSQRDDVQRTELVLAITPRILRTAPRPDISQAEMWVGTEMATRLRASPLLQTPSVVVAKEAAPLADAAAQAAEASVNKRPAPPPATTPAVASPIAVSGPTRLSWQAPAEVKVGDTFTVELGLASATALRGAPMEIAFPSQAFEVLEVSEGTFFKQDDGVTSFTHAVNASTGRIGLAVLRSDTTGATGQAPVVMLRLKAKTAGPATLSLSSFKPVPLGGEVPLADFPVLNLVVK